MAEFIIRTQSAGKPVGHAKLVEAADVYAAIKQGRLLAAERGAHTSIVRPVKR